MHKIIQSKRVIALTLMLSAITVSIALFSTYLDYKDAIETKKAILFDYGKIENTLIQTLSPNEFFIYVNPSNIL